MRSGPVGAALTVIRRNAAGAIVQMVTKFYPPNFFEQVGGSAFFEGAAYGANDSITIQVGAGSVIVYAATADATTQDPSAQFAVKAP